jgi:hypothetical protein
MKTLKEFNSKIKILGINEMLLSNYNVGYLHALKEVQELLYNLSKIESKTYSIEDIEHCVENWGLCKVEQEEIERFLNK